MNRRRVMVVAAGGLLILGGCINVKAPERVVVNRNERHQSEDAAAADRNMPETHSHEEARAALRREYERNAALERQLADRDREIRKLKEDLRDAKKEHDRNKD